MSARAPDERQLPLAFEQRRILVTHNASDFLLVHRGWRLWPEALGIDWPQHPGIHIVPQPAELPTPRVVEKIDRFTRSGRRISNELFRLYAWGGWRRER